MKRLVFMPVVVAMLCGCQALENAVDSAKEKNLAIGSNSYGGGGAASFTGSTEAAPLSCYFWFGRRTCWYISIKNDNAGEKAGMAEMIRASNSALKVSAGAAGVSMDSDAGSSAK